LIGILKFLPVLLVALGAAQSVFAQNLNILHSFAGGSDGSHPSGALISSVGSLYGTTEVGGTSDAGTVFRITASGAENVLRSFGNLPDGQEPSYVALVHDSADNLYGTTYEGGGTGCFSGSGCGTVFKLSPKGHEDVLYAFQGGVDEANPEAGLTIDAAGNLYGTTVQGGGTGCGGYGCGTVFKISPTGQETVLHAFSDAPDGANPVGGGLIRDAEGNLYGTTSLGGLSNLGTVFRLSRAGVETVLYSFGGAPDAAYPWAGLYLYDGDLFGATVGGGSSTLCGGGCGAVFKLTKAGKETVLYSFSGLADGAQPFGRLTGDKSGNLYGTTPGGGDPVCTCGTIFKLTKEDAFTTLHSFTGGADGSGPYAGVILDTSGNIYGTTFFGGASNLGTVYELTP
jgi:uncharacterized repeat protein (TIGR03803 family)